MVCVCVCVRVYDVCYLRFHVRVLINALVQEETGLAGERGGQVLDHLREVEPHQVGLRREVPHAVIRKKLLHLREHAEHLQPLFPLELRFLDLLDDEDFVRLPGNPSVVPKRLLSGAQDFWRIGKGEYVSYALEFESLKRFIASLVRALPIKLNQE